MWTFNPNNPPRCVDQFNLARAFLSLVLFPWGRSDHTGGSMQ